MGELMFKMLKKMFLKIQKVNKKKENVNQKPGNRTLEKHCDKVDVNM